MIIIRLQRRGRKHDPSFRVIVTDSKRAAQSGKYLEMVGSYDPRVDRADLKADRITHWIEHGAQVSDTVHNLLISQKIIEGKKINVLPKKTVPKDEKKEEPAAEPAAQPVAVELNDIAGEAVQSEGIAEEAAEEAAPVTVSSEREEAEESSDTDAAE